MRIRCPVSTVERMRSRTSYPSPERDTSPTDGRAMDRARRHWRPLAVTVATLTAAGVVIAATAAESSEIMCSGNNRWTTSPLALASRAAASATCVAWPPAKRDIDAVSAVPAGWYWDKTTRTYDLRDHAAAVGQALDHFASQVAATDPAPVATAAHTYVTAKRAELKALTDRTFDDTVASAVTVARVKLNRACGLPDKAQARPD